MSLGGDGNPGTGAGLPLWSSRRTLQATLQGANSHLDKQPAHYEKANPPKGGDAKLQGLRLKHSATTASCRNRNLPSSLFGPWTCCSSDVHGLFIWQANGVNGVSRVAIQARLLRDRSIVRAPILATLVVGTVAIGACAGSPTLAPQLQPTVAEFQSTPSASDPDPEDEATVTLTGWLSIVWNDEPHFFLTQDDGQTVEVLLDERLTQSFGGPLALDRSRVVVLAMVNPEFLNVFQALSIEIEAGG